MDESSRLRNPATPPVGISIIYSCRALLRLAAAPPFQFIVSQELPLRVKADRQMVAIGSHIAQAGFTEFR